MSNIDLPTNLLRTFVAVTDLGSYTRAGEALSRTQPAISLQIRRLEQLTDARLIRQVGKNLVLTEAGQTLLTYARQILHLNDQAVAKFRQADMAGILKVGLPTDFAVSSLQKAVVAFSAAHSDVDVEIHCARSRELIEILHADKIHIAVALISEDLQQYLVNTWQELPIWATAKDSDIHKQRPIALLAHPEGCEYRNRMITALKKTGSDWRMAYTSPDISGLQEAVNAGLGVTALTHATLTAEMRILGAREGFADMEKIRIGLFYKQPRLPKPGLELSNTLIATLDNAIDESASR